MRAIHTHKYYGIDYALESGVPNYEFANWGNWFVVECMYFFSYIVSLMLFLFCSFWIKFKSIRKKKYDFLQEDGI